MVSKSNTGLSIFKKMKFKGTKRFRKEPPNICPYCSSTDTIGGIEVIAAYDGVLFWECEHCGEKLLRFTKQTTVKHLDKTKDLHIDLGELENIWDTVPN